MANFSDYTESGLIQHLFRTGSFAKPTSLAIALCSGVPQDSNTGVTIPELANAGNYSRYLIGAPSDAAFLYQGLNGTTENTSGIAWAAASANWGWVSGFAIVDSATYGQGNVIMHGALTTAKFVTAGDIMTIPSGNIDIFVY